VPPYKTLSSAICASPVSFVKKLNSDIATTQVNHSTNFIQLKQLLANFSLRSPGFNPRADYAEFLVDKVVLDLFEYFGSSTNTPHSSSKEKHAVSETPAFCSRMTRQIAWKNYCNILLGYFPCCTVCFRLMASCGCVCTQQGH